MPRHCINTLRGIGKCLANSTTTAIITVRQVKPFEVGRERSMLREEDNILSNPVSGMETNCGNLMVLKIFLPVSPFFHEVYHSSIILFRRKPFMCGLGSLVCE
ncbi:hypothetical protein AVEN_52607-1 [Araneus ventricosus]|uniref:Uncharacterized protein n=1 Tax=Araneus ventricosus TaxID=182803 RepID=A0A4Y2ENE3_ARAVE|nr:hypothetical protein AVEN_52607-1 [Araneus ventricosus]